MEEEIKNNKPAEQKPPVSSFRPGAQNVIIPSVPSPSSKPTTPLPKVAQPIIPPIPPIPQPLLEQKKDTMTLLLIVALILNILSLWIAISIGLNKIPGFLGRLF
jgi:hypothetical protein